MVYKRWNEFIWRKKKKAEFGIYIQVDKNKNGNAKKKLWEILCVQPNMKVCIKKKENVMFQY